MHTNFSFFYINEAHEEVVNSVSEHLRYLKEVNQFLSRTDISQDSRLQAILDKKEALARLESEEVRYEELCYTLKCVLRRKI